MAAAPPLDMLVWLKPETLSALSLGDPVAVWPDSGQLGNDLVQTDASVMPVWTPNGGGPADSVAFSGVHAMSVGRGPLQLGSEHTVYLVDQVAAGLVYQYSGPALLGDPPSMPPRCEAGGAVMSYRTSGPSVSVAVSLPGGSPDTWCWRRTPSTLELYHRGDVDVTLASSPGAVVTLSGLRSRAVSLPRLSAIGVAEMLVYDRALTDAEHAGVLAYLAGRYGP